MNRIRDNAWKLYKLAAIAVTAYVAVAPATASAQAYCPSTALKSNRFHIARYDGAGTVTFIPWTYKYVSYGNFYTPLPTATANQYGQLWKWRNAYIGVERCDSYVGQNGTIVHIVDFDENNVQGYAQSVSGINDCDDDGGWGGELRVGPTGQKNQSAKVKRSAEATPQASCNGGGSPSDPQAPQPGAGSSTCIPPGCYSIYVDGAYVGSACFDVQLCIRV